jgi:hypothetical protein
VWLQTIEQETNYLVSKGYSWSDIREMESSRRMEYIRINIEIDKQRAEASRAPVT